MDTDHRDWLAALLGWKVVPSTDDPAGWCWLLPHGSTRASTTPDLETSVAEQLRQAHGMLGRMLAIYEAYSQPWSTLTEARRLIEVEARQLGVDTNEWH